ncbi:MAG: ubiquinone/menaquinone biosynthesis methyltransferase, partial [Myxococcota bacterium]
MTSSTTSSPSKSYQGPPAQKIQTMFDRIAPSYDRLNNILSLGIHHMWKSKLIKLSGAKLGDQILDCATGTGDLARLFARTVGSEGNVIATDFSEQMLVHAKQRIHPPHLCFEQADVTQLPYEDQRFDVCSISFGIRNVENPLQGIAEMLRVTRPGGRVLIMEFGRSPYRLWRALYHMYAK